MTILSNPLGTPRQQSADAFGSKRPSVEFVVTKQRYFGATEESDPAEAITEFQIITEPQPFLAAEAIQAEIAELNSRIIGLQQSIKSRPYSITVNSLAPEPYILTRPISVVMREVDDGFVADFLEANIGASGDSEIVALRNLKDLIILTYEDLIEEDGNVLSPVVAEQLAILRDLLQSR